MLGVLYLVRYIELHFVLNNYITRQTESELEELLYPLYFICAFEVVFIVCK